MEFRAATASSRRRRVSRGGFHVGLATALVVGALGMLGGAAASVIGISDAPAARALTVSAVSQPAEPRPFEPRPFEPLPVDPVESDAPTPTPTPEPTPTPTTEPETPTPTPEPTDEPTGEPVVPTETVEPTESAPPTQPPTETPVPTVVPGIPPAVADPTTSVLSWIIAAVVLVVAAGILLFVRRTPSATPGDAGEESPVGGEPGDSSDDETRWAPPATATLAAMEDIGSAMTDAGYSVATVHETLLDVARANKLIGAEIVVFPTALLVSARGVDTTSTGAIASGERLLLLDQIDELQHIVDDARSGEADPAELRERVARMRDRPRPYSPLQRGAAYLLLSAGLAVLLGASWSGVVAAAVLGAGVGAALLAGERLPARYQSLLTVALAFTVALAVLIGMHLGLDSGALPAVIAPLVILLPGGLLTVGAIELATGQMMSGAGRLAAGAMQLVLLAVGVVAAGALVGIPSVAVSGSATTLGVLAPWIAVALFGVGIVVYKCGPWSSLGWILVVLYVAYGAQVLGSVFFGGVLSSLIGALVVTPVTVIVARQRSGPAPLVSFMPAFWLLVPGALGLVGVATALGGDTTGSSALITTLATMVAISLGVLAGTAVSSRFGRPVL
ncbi:Uncharacterized membrane protein YjjP, DUF1212 family [Agromyces sp. CF514]|uniref:threonine/serine ThrE exporter family protein n=1 Tax=Agromyces sp. CF514 TaxID=1881031 RepID=UPI0008E6DFEB|nr:threonine/serine exporter family protein [Agromyces sp. CF514]SFR67613.1 Uncharacterized membrane protein YjjP, DUF1212 family [Agromyces sp. CF514]